MARAPVAARLRHMLEAIARIETLTAGKTFEDYGADRVTRDAACAISSGFPKRRATFLRS